MVLTFAGLHDLSYFNICFESLFIIDDTLRYYFIDLFNQKVKEQNMSKIHVIYTGVFKTYLKK